MEHESRDLFDKVKHFPFYPAHQVLREKVEEELEQLQSLGVIQVCGPGSSHHSCHEEGWSCSYLRGL